MYKTKKVSGFSFSKKAKAEDQAPQQTIIKVTEKFNVFGMPSVDKNTLFDIEAGGCVTFSTMDMDISVHGPRVLNVQKFYVDLLGPRILNAHKFYVNLLEQIDVDVVGHIPDHNDAGA